MSSGEKTQPMWAVLAVCQCWRLYVGFIGSWSQAFNALSPQTRVAAELSPVHTIATMSKQRSTLSKGRNFNAKLVRHCCRFWQQSRTFDIVAKNGNNVEATFDIVAFDNVASTLLLVWTGLYTCVAACSPEHSRKHTSRSNHCGNSYSKQRLESNDWK